MKGLMMNDMNDDRVLAKGQPLGDKDTIFVIPTFSDKESRDLFESMVDEMCDEAKI